MEDAEGGKGEQGNTGHDRVDDEDCLVRDCPAQGTLDHGGYFFGGVEPVGEEKDADQALERKLEGAGQREEEEEKVVPVAEGGGGSKSVDQKGERSTQSPLTHMHPRRFPLPSMQAYRAPMQVLSHRQWWSSPGTDFRQEAQYRECACV